MGNKEDIKILDAALALAQVAEKGVIYTDIDYRAELLEKSAYVRNLIITHKGSYKGKKPKIGPKDKDRINFLWFTNQRNITDIGRIMSRAPSTCEKHLCKTKNQWEVWRMAHEKELE